MALFDYIEVFYNQRRRHSTLGQISLAASNDAGRLRNDHGGALGGSHSPATDDDGYATKRPSTFYGHRRET